MADRPEAERTEEATPRRREEARDEGRIPRSQELTIAVSLLGSAAVLSAARRRSPAAACSRSWAAASPTIGSDHARSRHRPRTLLRETGFARSSATLGLIVALTRGVVRRWPRCRRAA